MAKSSGSKGTRRRKKGKWATDATPACLWYWDDTNKKWTLYPLGGCTSCDPTKPPNRPPPPAGQSGYVLLICPGYGQKGEFHIHYQDDDWNFSSHPH
jgi:hypothetical protein